MAGKGVSNKRLGGSLSLAFLNSGGGHQLSEVRKTQYINTQQSRNQVGKVTIRTEFEYCVLNVAC